MTRTAVVTGVGRGIGRAIGTLFRERGWRVVGVDIDRPEAGGGAPPVDEFFATDLGDDEQLEALVRQLGEVAPRVDALVNNAAVQVVKALVDTSPEELDRVLAVNVRAPFLLTRGLHRALAQARGAVVNIASVHASATSPGLAAYVTSKGAIAAFTRAAALELADAGVRVNAVLPGAVDTDMLRAGLGRMSEADAAAFAAAHPVGRVGEPRDIAEMVLYLADGEKSSFVTGSLFTVDGGATARLSLE